MAAPLVRGLISVDRLESARPFRPVVRKRVSARITQAALYRICLLVAPAGYGKSIAMRHYLENSTRPHIRYSLGRDNSTLLGFMRGFLDSIDEFAPRSSRSLASVYERAQRSENLVVELASWLAVLLKRFEGTIALDDLHVADAVVSKLLVELIERTSEGVSWIIATRDPLDLPVASWLAYGRMDMPIDEIDLKLTADEAVDAAAVSGVRMHESELRMLWELTDGWPTAFAFALRTTTRTQDLRRVAAGTRDMMFAYLAEQILNGIDKSDREFLMATSVLSEIDIDAFDEAGRADVESRILRLQKKTSFIVAEAPRVFKYHDLFRDFLEHQLKAEGQERYDRALEDAGQLLERVGRTDRALALYIQARDVNAMSRLLKSHGADLLDHGNIEVVERALTSLPAGVRSSESRVIMLSAQINVFRGRLSEAAGLYRSALTTESELDLRVDIACRFAALLVNQFKFVEANLILQDFDVASIEPRDLKARFLGILATVRTSIGDMSAARLMADAVAIVSEVDDDRLRAEIYHQAGHVAWRTGLYDDARRLAGMAAQIAESQGLFALAARATSVLASIAHAAGDQVSGYWALSQIMRLAERGGDRAAWFYGLANSFDLAAEQSDGERLIDLEGKLKDTTGSDEYRAVTESLLPAFALQAAWSSDFAGAYRLLLGTADNMGTPSHKVLRSSEIALYAAACNERDSADEALRSSSELLARLGNGPESTTPRVIRAKVWSALAALILGRSSVSNKFLKEVEKDSRRLTPGVRSLVALARATYVHVETGAAHDEMALRLAEARDAGLGGYAKLVEQLPLPVISSAPRFAALTKTEVQILRALALGSTSRTIAQEIGRSPQTVDAHVKSIIKKLGCSGRQEAVRSARSHGIV